MTETASSGKIKYYIGISTIEDDGNDRMTTCAYLSKDDLLSAIDEDESDWHILEVELPK